ncbi:hypothetical protein CDAR_51581 [Caerostris darwini]|uniref:Uncharacterized protein n=1 Tax=Caerostris darwini TaxID=1538125 RepID=A0AAV4VSL8_9ARAC|nr:hypothetical protein CDAR_51581 [Caerostris darwini]
MKRGFVLLDEFQRRWHANSSSVFRSDGFFSSDEHTSKQQKTIRKITLPSFPSKNSLLGKTDRTESGYENRRKSCKHECGRSHV